MNEDERMWNILNVKVLLSNYIEKNYKITSKSKKKKSVKLENLGENIHHF